jgi:L-serine/L-threonine ammonia-lyase
VAVETEGADWLDLSIKRGERVTLSKISSIATSLGAITGTDEIFTTLREKTVRNHVVTDTAAVRVC